MTRKVKQQGFTLVEVAVVAVLILILGMAMTTMAHRGHEAQDFVQRSSRVNESAQAILGEMRRRVSSSMRLFYEDVEGQAYFSGLDTSPLPPIAKTKLPAVRRDASFAKELSSDPRTGNALLLARHERTSNYVVDALGTKHRVDVYRLHALYLVAMPNFDPQNSVDGLELAHWVSEPLVDWGQVEQLGDATKEQLLLQQLYSGANPDEPSRPWAPARTLWRPGSEFSQAFASVQNDGTRLPIPPGWRVPMSAKRSVRGRLGSVGLSVAANAAGSARGLGRFGIVDTTDSGFPHGFETQVIGPASARQVLVHLTLVNSPNRKQRSWFDLVGVAETRDL